jgi:predicted TIM-barrel fold metal-dependent hydrolase
VFSKVPIGVFALLFSVLSCGISPNAAHKKPFADIHVHFNWDQKEVISAEQIAAKIRNENVTIMVVSGTPSALALELHEADPQHIIPFFSPYITATSRQNWYLDDNVLRQAEQGLANQQYAGIGELHLWAGMAPRRDNAVFQGLLDLAEKYQVPFSIHTEAADQGFFLPICQSRPKVRFLWAHAGGTLAADQVKEVLEKCDNVWVELSARDPWRYNTLVDETNKLLPGWRTLCIEYADRFMTGTDPVWSVRKGQRWDAADDGWDHFEKLLEFHRSWLAQLPPDVEEKIRFSNAKGFLATEL